MANRYVLGKVDYNNSGRKNCEAVITWELRDGRFSMQAEIWNPRKTDIYCGGQCVDMVAAYFPQDAKAQRMLAIWREWHLNDMQAGSPAQREWIAAHPEQSHDYMLLSAALEGAGLNPDPNFLHNGKPYKYGHAWLKRELPADVIAEIESW